MWIEVYAFAGICTAMFCVGALWTERRKVNPRDLLLAPMTFIALVAWPAWWGWYLHNG